jgi:hypothetical protein
MLKKKKSKWVLKSPSKPYEWISKDGRSKTHLHSLPPEKQLKYQENLVLFSFSFCFDFKGITHKEETKAKGIKAGK